MPPKRPPRPIAPVARMLLTRKEAAASLGMSLGTFERYVQPFIRVTVVGQLVQVRPSELERWIGDHERAPVRPGR